MDRVRVYALIAAELDRWQTLPRSEVVERVGKPAEVSSALIDGAEVTIEVRVSWADDTQRQLRVGAAAYGPSSLSNGAPRGGDQFGPSFGQAQFLKLGSFGWGAETRSLARFQDRRTSLNRFSQRIVFYEAWRLLAPKIDNVVYCDFDVATCLLNC